MNIEEQKCDWKFYKTWLFEDDQQTKSLENLWYKCYGSSSPRPVESLHNFIRYKCEKINSLTRRPDISGGNQQAHYLKVYQRFYWKQG